MIRIEADTIYFSSGRTAYANNGIVGLCPKLTISEGYDGGIPWPRSEYDDPDEGDLTAADMAELADYMIELWGKFKTALPR